jgi:hypothetical protein
MKRWPSTLRLAETTLRGGGSGSRIIAAFGGYKQFYFSRHHAERQIRDPREDTEAARDRALQAISGVVWMVDIHDSSSNRSIFSAYVDRSPESWEVQFPVISEVYYGREALTLEELHGKLDHLSVNISMMRRSDGAIRCVTQVRKTPSWPRNWDNFSLL